MVECSDVYNIFYNVQSKEERKGEERIIFVIIEQMINDFIQSILLTKAWVGRRRKIKRVLRILHGVFFYKKFYIH